MPIINVAQGCGGNPIDNGAQRGLAIHAPRMRLEYRELGVGGCAGADDGAATVDLGGAAERRGVGRGLSDHLVEHLADR